MLIKVRKLPESFSGQLKNLQSYEGFAAVQTELGELVRVPEVFREPAELLVGELSMSLLPIGVELAVGGEFDGLWVSKEIFDHVRNQAAAAA